MTNRAGSSGQISGSGAHAGIEGVRPAPGTILAPWQLRAAHFGRHQTPVFIDMIQRLEAST